jgi:transcriptional regulator with XRE-family HTH domain
VELATIPAARRLPPLRRALNAARIQGVPAYIVAEEAGISKAMLSRVASGDVPATPETAKRIARALGCPVTQLFPGVASSRNGS